jgi:uncharacterized repeat protein (TIGR04138 family)
MSNRLGKQPEEPLNAGDQIAKLAKEISVDKRAFEFIHIALLHATNGKQQHISAAKLINSTKVIGHYVFGFLAKTVFNQWGINTTDDWGRVVWALVESGIWGKQEGDKQSDFDGLWDFETLESEFKFIGDIKNE